MCHAAAANLWLYGLTVSTLSALMHARRKNANNGPAPVQKLDRRRSNPVLDRPGPGPVTEPVWSLTPTQAVLHPTRTYTAHTYLFFSCPWAGTLDQRKGSALWSRVAHNNKPTAAVIFQVQQAAYLKSMDPQLFCNEISADFKVWYVYIANVNGFEVIFFSSCTNVCHCLW